MRALERNRSLTRNPKGVTSTPARGDYDAMYKNALAAGMEAPEDYLEVSLAWLDALRRQATPIEPLREAFQATTELMQVSWSLL